MVKRYLLLGMCLMMTSPLVAAERTLIDFELIKGKIVIENGRLLVSEKPRTWSQGLKRSYLKLGCRQLESGRVEKRYSNVDYFSGFSVKHRIVDNTLALIAERSSVKSRLKEIRALAKDECKELAPIVTTTKQTYNYPATGVKSESRLFDDQMTFRITIKSMQEIEGGTD